MKPCGSGLVRQVDTDCGTRLDRGDSGGSTIVFISNLLASGTGEV